MLRPCCSAIVFIAFFLLFLFSIKMIQKQDIYEYTGQFTSNQTVPPQTSVEDAKTTAPSTNFNERLLGEMPSCEGVTGPVDLQEQFRWDVLRVIFRVLKAAAVPYYLTDGSLLFLVRDCQLGDSDMDFNVDAIWWRIPGNAKILKDAMDSTGLKKVHNFGVLEKFGYEERWMIQGLQVDIFSSDSVVDGFRREAVWWAEDKVYQCPMKVVGFIWYSWWGELVRLPYPFEPTLVSLYGPNYTVRESTNYFKYSCVCDPSGLGWPTHPEYIPPGCCSGETGPVNCGFTNLNVINLTQSTTLKVERFLQQIKNKQ